jgi:glycosyltransferase involved in cell wall biosynthesis
MKVLYIGHYKEQTGWGKAARDYILALDAAGVEVVPRAVKLSDSNKPEIPERILELEAKSTKGCTHCIQHVLPHHLEFNGNFEKSIALCVYESFGASLSAWPAKINTMDELWVPTEFCDICFSSMLVDIPTRVVPHAFDLTQYSKPREKIYHPELAGNFVFYTIGDLNKRKDMLSLIQAFHLEFSPNEPIKLLIKTGKHGASPQECAQIVIDECTKIKQSMKLYNKIETYSSEVVIADRMSDEDILRLHATCDCFVTTSHGEAWSIPLFDAIAMGKPCVYPAGMFPYTDGNYGFEMAEAPVFGMNDTFSHIGTSRETWYTGNIESIQACMRDAYTYGALDNKVDLSPYSHLNVGLRMKEYLNDTK